MWYMYFGKQKLHVFFLFFPVLHHKLSALCFFLSSSSTVSGVVKPGTLLAVLGARYVCHFLMKVSVSWLVGINVDYLNFIRAPFIHFFKPVSWLAWYRHACTCKRSHCSSSTLPSQVLLKNHQLGMLRLLHVVVESLSVSFVTTGFFLGKASCIYISKEDSGINNNNKNVFKAREQFLAWSGNGGGGGVGE